MSPTGSNRTNITNNGKNHHTHSLVALRDVDEEDETQNENDNDIGSIQRRVTRNKSEQHRRQIPNMFTDAPKPKQAKSLRSRNSIHGVIDTAGDNSGIHGYDANSRPNTVGRFDTGNGHRSIELES